MDPIKVIIENYPINKYEEFEVPNHPKDESKGKRKLYFSNVIYIDRNDFREKDEKDYYGLALNKEVGLRYGYNITCTSIEEKDNEKVISIKATVDLEKKNKPKGKIKILNFF